MTIYEMKRTIAILWRALCETTHMDVASILWNGLVNVVGEALVWNDMWWRGVGAW